MTVNLITESSKCVINSNCISLKVKKDDLLLIEIPAVYKTEAAKRIKNI